MRREALSSQYPQLLLHPLSCARHPGSANPALRRLCRDSSRNRVIVASAVGARSRPSTRTPQVSEPTAALNLTCGTWNSSSHQLFIAQTEQISRILWAPAAVEEDRVSQYGFEMAGDILQFQFLAAFPSCRASSDLAQIPGLPPRGEAKSIYAACIHQCNFITLFYSTSL